MSAIRETVRDTVAEVLAFSVGLVFCLSVLAGAFGLGVWLAEYVGWTRSPDMLGLLTALAVVWMFEHHDREQKYKRLREVQDQAGMDP